MRLPESFDYRIGKQLGKEYDDYISCLDKPMYHGIRINNNKISTDDFLKISPFELKPVLWTDNGFYFDKNKCTPSKHPYYYAGLYYIQEPSAMLPAATLPIEDGDMVLDICAAPGGKSTELAARLNKTGFIISNDISSSRAKALLKNMELSGIGNMAVISEPPNVLCKRFKGFFDKILIDAPCSGEGMFRKSSQMVTAWENNGVEMFQNIQKSILKEAVNMLKPGGKILYSTCTFSPEEDEQSVEYLLSLDDSLSLCDIHKIEGFDDGHPEWGRTGNPELAKCARLWPHRIEGEGHFAALFEKKNDENSDISCISKYSYRSFKAPDYVTEFFSHINPSCGIDLSHVEENNGRLMYIPDNTPDVRGLRTLRNGLFLGELKKNRFEPSESLAMYLKAEEYDNICSLRGDSDEVMKYLKGETIFTDEVLHDGYVLVCADGYPLGWAKNNNGTLKNKYLSGWRMM